MTSYTMISSYPEGRASMNVGDLLIHESEKQLILREKGPADFLTFFREDPLDEHLEKVNDTAAVIVTFAVRDTPMYPGTIRLSEDLEKIKVPIIPMPANWNVYPGDVTSRQSTSFSKETVHFLRKIAGDVETIPCREFHTAQVLRNHGIHNVSMTGDPSWYDFEYFGVPFHRPAQIEKVVFTPPLSPYYFEQARDTMAMLAETFPESERYCALHLADRSISQDSEQAATNDASMSDAVARKNIRIRLAAEEYGFQVREVFGDVDKLQFYKESDLHVGYECHAHVSFLRWRRPSILIAEDARGVGFNYTFGVGGFNGFVRAQGDPKQQSKEGGTSGYCVTGEEFATAPTSHTLVAELRQYILEEVETRFRRYLGVGPFIEETYELGMRPFLQSLPS